jgi:hypothetical protein
MLIVNLGTFITKESLHATKKSWAHCFSFKPKDFFNKVCKFVCSNKILHHVLVDSLETDPETDPVICSNTISESYTILRHRHTVIVHTANREKKCMNRNLLFWKTAGAIRWHTQENNFKIKKKKTNKKQTKTQQKTMQYIFMSIFHPIFPVKSLDHRTKEL